MHALERDPDSATLNHRERAIVDYARKLTRQPEAMVRGDVDCLREAGLTEASILDVCQVAAYYAFVNRLASGLGVELEHWWGDATPE